MAGIVVGVDGSPTSKQALRWALAEARCHDSTVRVVTAASFPYSAGEIAHQAALSAAEPLEQAAHTLQDDAVQAVGDATNGVSIQRLVVQGPAAAALLDAARDADLLVVGSRGRGGFVGLLLGSVSQQCVQHATCPVVVVRDKQTGG